MLAKKISRMEANGYERGIEQGLERGVQQGLEAGSLEELVLVA